MEVKLREVTVAELIEGYANRYDEGVVGYGGRLDIRPRYQREFVYDTKKCQAVIDTVMKGYPLNVMYWSDNGDDTYEIIDGQQRTMAIANYTERAFSYNDLYFHNLDPSEQQLILGYELTIYVCSGTDREKLKWFETVNIAGEPLSKQELRNAVYSGTWVTDAKRYFSRPGCLAAKVGGDYLAGARNRQKYLETAISWISHDSVDDYMARQQDQDDARELWEHFESVIDWVKRVFTTRPKLMKGVDWGTLYDAYKDASLDPVQIESATSRLMMDDEVQRKSGIYPYLLDGQENHLKLRAFTLAMKTSAYERQQGKCAICKKAFDFDEMQGDHKVPWSKGGKTVVENCQMLCRPCNQRKGAN